MISIRKIFFSLALLLLIIPAVKADDHYKNFKVAVYSRAYETVKMGDNNWIEPIWDEVTRQLKVDKIYLETHRDLLVVDEATLLKAKNFFESRGVKTAGGITLTVNESNNFQTFCYSNPEHRKKIKEIVEFTAKHFDELILDDFFFTTCKCELCIKAKGNRSWTDFRLDLMTKAAKELIIDPAKAVNPNIKVVIKYPNWYDHFQGNGFNLETEPKMFDGIYTGTETRDPSSNQHLQQYLGYSVFRYFNNLKPGKNGGGWVDPGGLTYMDRYAEQLWLTLFAKAPEITLFDIRQLQRPLQKSDRAEWQNTLTTSFNFDEMMKPVANKEGKMVAPTTIARAAGYTFETIDQFIGQLGNPVGVKSYKPFHSLGEDFLQNYMGMIGVPMDIVPEFPENEPIVFLTEQAKSDPEIMAKIKKQLLSGKDIMITSGFLKAMQDKVNDIVELRVTDQKASVKEFVAGWGAHSYSDHAMLIPQIRYNTNDSWEVVSALDGTNGWPIVHRADYAKGKLYVLTIPENVIDLYHLPVDVLTRIKEILTPNMPAVLEAPGYTSLFVYDNNTLIVESFADETRQVKLQLADAFSKARNLVSGEEFLGEKKEYPQRRKPSIIKSIINLELKPHSFVVLQLEK
ncbi:MAG TPA: hypothetical protein DCL77_06355 [Prolixibacteraceae bacterium]|jgi:hypothetical protein|nr:hypothetical protein [Prolixibacteraceae bacterium]